MKTLALIFFLALAGQASAQVFGQVSVNIWDQPNWKVIDKRGNVLFDNLAYAPCLKFVQFTTTEGEQCVVK